MWSVYAEANSWNHLAFTANQGTCILYVNGIERVRVQAKYDPIENQEAYLLLGHKQLRFKELGWENDSLQGFIDEIRLWDYSRSSNEILTTMNIGLESYDGITGYWPIHDIENESFVIKDMVNMNDGYYATVNTNRQIEGPSVSPTLCPSNAPIMARGIPTIIVSGFSSETLNISYNDHQQCQNYDILVDTFPLGWVFNKNGQEITSSNPTITPPEIDYIQTPFNYQDNLRYKVEGCECQEEFGNISIEIKGDIVAPSPKPQTITITVNNMAYIGLYCKGTDFTAHHAIVETLPSNGKLYEIEYDKFNNVYQIVGNISQEETDIQNPRKVIAYRPSGNWAGTDSFSYSCSAFNTKSESAEVTIITEYANSISLIGPSRYALEFDGLNTFATVPFGDSSQLRSLSLNMKVGINNYLEMPILSGEYGNPADGNLKFILYLIREHQENPFSLMFESRKGTTPMRVYSTNDTFIVPNVWLSVGFNFISSDSLSIMINGVQTGIGKVHYNSYCLSISLAVYEMSHFVGQMTNIQLWSSSLPTEELFENSQSCLTGTENGLLAYWPLDEGHGTTSKDFSVNNFDINMSDSVFNHPQWVVADMILNRVFVNQNSSTIIELKSYSEVPSIPIAYVITQIPSHGILYNLPESFNKRADPSEAHQIARPYDTTNGLVITEMWVSSVINYSSARNSTSNRGHWSPLNVIGPPRYYRERLSSPQEFHEDHVYSWSPYQRCSGDGIEFVEVRFSKAVYIVDIDIYENFNPGSVKRISTYNPKKTAWEVIFERENVTPGPQSYVIYRPPICNIFNYKTDQLRLELDVCTYPGYKGIEAIKIYGTETIQPSIILSQSDTLVYKPNIQTSGKDADSFSYTVSECRLPTLLSPSFKYSISSRPVNLKPFSNDTNLIGEENGDLLIKLESYDFDTTSILQHLITRVPNFGTLLQVDSNLSSLEKKVEYLVENRQGYVLYRPPPNQCGENFTDFSFSASDSELVSTPATLTISISCTPGKHIIPIPLLYIVLSAQGILMFSIIMVFVFVVKKYWLREFYDCILLAFLVLPLLCLSFIIFFHVIPPSKGACYARLWMFHLGFSTCTAILTNSFYFQWRHLARKNATFMKSSRFVVSAILVVEIAQLTAFTILNDISSEIVPYGDNSSLRIAICKSRYFGEYYLMLWKALVLVVTLTMCALLLTWPRPVSYELRYSTVTLLMVFIISAIGSPIIYTSSGYTVQFIFYFFLTSIIPTLAFMIHLIRIIPRKKNHGDSNKKKSIPMKSMKSSDRSNKKSHSDEKSVMDLINTIEKKDKEVESLKAKLLKRDFKIRKLEHKLLSYDSAETV